MGVQQYIESRKHATRVDNTVQHRLSKAFIAMSEATIGDDGLADYSRFTDSTFRTEQGAAAYDAVRDWTIQFVGTGLDPTDDKDRIKLAGVVFGTTGLRADDFAKYLDSAGRDANMGSFFGYLNQNTGMGYVQGIRADEAKRHITMDDKGDVLRATETGTKVHSDRLEAEDLQWLMDKLYVNEGPVPNKDLKGQHFVRKGSLDSRLVLPSAEEVQRLG